MRFVYLLECDGLVKIGSAANPTSRLAQCQTGNPFPVKLLWKEPAPDAYAVEKKLHALFATKKVRNEWFDLGPNPVDEIKKAFSICCPGNETERMVRHWQTLPLETQRKIAKMIMEIKEKEEKSALKHSDSTTQKPLALVSRTC